MFVRTDPSLQLHTIPYTSDLSEPSPEQPRIAPLSTVYNLLFLAVNHNPQPRSLIHKHTYIRRSSNICVYRFVLGMKWVSLMTAINLFCPSHNKLSFYLSIVSQISLSILLFFSLSKAIQLMLWTSGLIQVKCFTIQDPPPSTGQCVSVHSASGKVKSINFTRICQ